MNIKSKYDFGQRLVIIQRKAVMKRTVCPICKGERQVKIEGHDIKLTCPECYGRGGTDNNEGEEWVISGSMIVNKIEVVLRTPELALERGDEREREVKYMEGNSGYVYYEEMLFPTKEEALDACHDYNVRDFKKDLENLRRN